MAVTRIEVAPVTTWWLVSTSPSADSTMPVPAPCAPSYPMVVTTSTRPFDTAAAAADCCGVRSCCGGAVVGGAPGRTPDGALGAGLGATGLARRGGRGGVDGVGRGGELGKVGVADGFGSAAEVLGGDCRVFASASPPISRTAATTAASTARARRGVRTGPSGGGDGATGGGE